MANDDYARGLVPLNTSGSKNFPKHSYLASTASDIFLGQPVAILSTGLVTGIGESGATVVLGVVAGFNVQGSILETAPFLDVSALTTDQAFVMVYDDPNQEYYIQEDTGGTALTQAEVGATADMVFRATKGNTTTGWINGELDADSVATNTSNLLQILRGRRFVNQDGTNNTLNADFAKWVVRIMHHQKAGAGQNPTA